MVTLPLQLRMQAMQLDHLTGNQGLAGPPAAPETASGARLESRAASSLLRCKLTTLIVSTHQLLAVCATSAMI
jgi:hypothetical protein